MRRLQAGGEIPSEEGESLLSQLMSDQLLGLLPFYQKLTLIFSVNSFNLKAKRNIKASFLAESEVLWFLRVKPGGAGGRVEAGLLALDGYL